MSERPDLRLEADEQTAFLHTALAADARVPWARAGADGYPEVGLAHTTVEAGALRFGAGGPPDGATICAIVERGATYDDITAVVARGRVHAQRVPLDDLVTFAFAKAARPR